MAEKKSSKARTRNYATVVYQDSAPENWREIISELKIPIFISPYHDKDLLPTGEPKKPHWHVMIMFEGVKTEDQAKEIIAKFNGVGCETVNSMRGYARYLCHLDSPDKAQYDIGDVQCYGGADYMNCIGTMADKAKAIREMMAHIEENDILYFSDLLMDCSVNHSDWFDCLINAGSYVIKEFIKSRTYKKDRERNGDAIANNEKLLQENHLLRERLEYYRKKEVPQ